jgi:hypothetical protein
MHVTTLFVAMSARDHPSVALYPTPPRTPLGAVEVNAEAEQTARVNGPDSITN